MNIDLQNILKRSRISQTKIAKDTGISQPLINGYALNKVAPSLDNLCILADYLHVTVDELLGRDTRLVNLASLDDNTREAIQSILSMTSDEVDKLLNIIKIVKS